ncbi:MAG: MBL fold metallo-hydrolase [Fibrobacteria bacterium]
MVGKKGVLLLDAPEGGGEALLQAVKTITPLPIKALLYSHAHVDHIGDALKIVEAVEKAGGKLSIIASRATADKLAFLESVLPKPTETVALPAGSFRFEGFEIRLHCFKRPAHTDDAAGWLIASAKILHLPDLVNLDQPPFWRFAGSENFTYYEPNLKEVDALDWVYLNGGHGNVGSHEDIKFYFAFLSDMKAAVG